MNKNLLLLLVLLGVVTAFDFVNWDNIDAFKNNECWTGLKGEKTPGPHSYGLQVGLPWLAV